MGDDVLPGNLGLWDQKMALEWVNENIKAFGEDPDRVGGQKEAEGPDDDLQDKREDQSPQT